MGKTDETPAAMGYKQRMEPLRQLTIRRRTTALLAACFAILCALPAVAAKLQVIDSTEAPWPSIGRVNVAGYRTTSMCTGTLIAPDIVLTAAHCFYDRHSLKPVPIDDLLFIAGVRRSDHAARLEAACFRTAEGFTPSKDVKLADIRNDVGIIILKEASSLDPIPPLSPQQAARLTKDTRFRSVGYRKSRRYLPTVVPACRILGQAKESWVTDCSSESGASGGPLLVETPDGPRVAGVMSARLDEDRSAIVPFFNWQTLLKNASCEQTREPQGTIRARPADAGN
ncbi:trypsin-like serine protease [Labrenzia sp. OB1]|uniref:trypsin-like serine peptidase n=1 Tax=Labrenzia sp. OB1 TaxID=1561204 RepID=UPI000838A2D1|nr:trypsin-like serine protease [Labrenzia sp. OB1]